LRGSFALHHPVETYRILRAPARLAQVLNCGVNPRNIRAWLEEAESITQSIRDRLEAEKWTPGRVDGSMALPDRGPFLYAAIRALRPEVAVETGVASGASTLYILSAMKRNCNGVLHSVDLPPEFRPNQEYNAIAREELPIHRDPGWLVPEALRKGWTLHVGDTVTATPRVLEALGTVDFFFHDSEHTYDVMTLEYRVALRHLAKRGVIGSDDVLWNDAFRDFTRENGLPNAVIGPMGFARKVRG
jgi:predicted O-methyltransferase YrrM